MSNNGNQVKKEPNGLFKAIGTQKLVAVIALIVLFMFFWIFGDNFAKYSTLVSIFVFVLLYWFYGHRCNICNYHRRNRLIHWYGLYLLFLDFRNAVYKTGTAYAAVRYPGHIDGRPVRTCQWTYGICHEASGLYCHTGNHDDYQTAGFDCDKHGHRDLSAGFGSGRLLQRHF